ncbi:L,D-transpeptidase [Patulibacter defluvii]|uniref:L,D-transpeptidase n=1 Tax=Patulibacter defluvii TaxID=3095358 RepID=UPI002A74842D|nr:L,D-transpeptidase [Patulibacter sp. DM4]
MPAIPDLTIRGGALALVAILIPTTAPAAGAAAPAPGAEAEQPQPKLERLSDERSSSFWAHPARVTAIHADHRSRARVVARTRLFTEDRVPEVYLVLERWTSEEGDEWLRVRVPKRPNGVTGWLPADALGALRRVRTQLVVDRRRRRVTLLERGRPVLTARVGIGMASTPTPSGRFYVREKLRFSGAPMYGTRALGTSAYAPTLSDWPNGGVVALHGTDQPERIPGRPSHGCVRLRNGDMARLFARTPVGTPIRIV